MKYAVIFALFSALVPSYVAAHGYLGKVVIDGKTYTGNEPGNANKDSAIRLVADINPVKGSNNPDLNCGRDAQPAKLVANANPGSAVEIGWNGGGGQQWPHNVGPVLTYLASCGSKSCADVDAGNLQWFKINEVGKKDNDPSKWVQEDFMSGKTYTINLPDDLAAGNYMLRNEIIALHLATEKGGAEFYPACMQLKVGGDATGAPDSSEEVTFPGGYSDSDPGIFDPNVFDTNAKYTFPGPKIAKLAATATGSGSSGDDDSSSAAVPSGTKGGASSTRSASSATATSTGKGSKGQCRLKRATSNSTSNNSAVRARQQHSRAMRRMSHAS
ncbi:glycosyl hydrolase family 61-domain-containing protein [Trametes elegans]|nr:glycosyl hydrolase family 61-domain-containing protein [Trametes elegans]